MADWMEEARARVEAASPGPWSYALTGEKDGSWAVGLACDSEDDDTVLTGCLNDWEDGTGGEYIVVDSVCEGIDGHPPDAAFIAHARTDVPRLLAAAEALKELVALHEGSQTQRPSRWETAWERARAALEGGE